MSEGPGRASLDPSVMRGCDTEERWLISRTDARFATHSQNAASEGAR